MKECQCPGPNQCHCAMNLMMTIIISYRDVAHNMKVFDNNILPKTFYYVIAVCRLIYVVYTSALPHPPALHTLLIRSPT